MPKSEKVCFYGATRSGKTKLFNFLCGFTSFKHDKPTLKPQFHTCYYVEGSVQYWDVPIGLSYYLSHSKHICLVFDRCNRKSFLALPGILEKTLIMAPDAIISVICPAEPARELTNDGLVDDDEIYNFLEEYHIPFENYLPLCLTSLASMDTLREHILNCLHVQEDKPYLQTQPQESNEIRQSPNSVRGVFTPVISMMSGLWKTKSKLNQNMLAEEAVEENIKSIRYFVDDAKY